MFEYQGITVAFKSNHSLEKLLDYPKDKVDNEINCNDWDNKCVGQIRKSKNTRFGEHFAILTRKSGK